MYTPFKKRATEYLRDGDALLAVVTPDFFEILLDQAIRDGVLFDRLTRIIGTPGSGKTTLAKILQFDNAITVARRREDHRELYDFLERLGIVRRGCLVPVRWITRLPMESEYRDFWELPYEAVLKNQLLLSFIQARAVLSWLRHIDLSEVSSEKITILVRENVHAAIESAGATSISALRERAIVVESAIYSIIGSLIPPSNDKLPDAAVGAYSPFSVLDGFEVSGLNTSLGIVLDDFHLLHKEQRKYLYEALTRREFRIGRWAMMRYDALAIPRVLALRDQAKDDELPSHVSQDREISDVRMQEPGSTTKFNKAAPKMADQQLAQIGLLRSHGVTTLVRAITVEPPPVNQKALATLKSRNEAFRRKNSISLERLGGFADSLGPYVSDAEIDVRERALAVLMERYVRRVPQVSLLEEVDVEPRRPVAGDAELVDACRLQLLHEFDRPYFFGPDILALAASGNAEQYLRLCSPLIDAIETQVIQGKGNRLTAALQHDRLRRNAQRYVDEWSFPENQAVRRLTNAIGKAALARTLEVTAPVTPGVNAVGIRADQYSDLLNGKYPYLAHVLKFAVAYNAIILDESGAKGQDWVLLRLSGLLCITWGLPFARHKFVDTVSLKALAAAADSA